MPKLALCMIVKNEERHLERALASVKDLVDEMIIVDTGSTDSTLSIANKFGAKIGHFTWNGSFSDARNHSLEMSSSDWNLVLDGDEFLSEADFEKIRQAISQADADMYFLTQTSYTNDSAILGWLPNHQAAPEVQNFTGYLESPLVRLFRNKSELRFKGIIHENIWDGGGHFTSKRLDVRIHHYGMLIDEEKKKMKKDLYLELGKKKCETHSQDAQAWYELGAQHLDMGQPGEARQAFEKSLLIEPDNIKSNLGLAMLDHLEGKDRESIDRYYKMLKSTPNEIAPYLYLPTVLADAKRFGEIEDLHQKVKNLHVENHPVYLLNLGIARFKEGRYLDSIRLLESNPLTKSNNPIVSFYLGECYRKLRHYERAKRYFQISINDCDMKPRTILKLAELYFDHGKKDECLNLLTQSRIEFPEDNFIKYQLAVLHAVLKDFDKSAHYISLITKFEDFTNEELANLAKCCEIINDKGALKSIMDYVSKTTPSKEALC